MLIRTDSHQHRWVNILRGKTEEGWVCRKCGRRVTRSWSLDELPRGGCPVNSLREMQRRDVAEQLSGEAIR